MYNNNTMFHNTVFILSVCNILWKKEILFKIYSFGASPQSKPLDNNGTKITTSSGACCRCAPSKKEGLSLVSFWILEIDVEASISIFKKKRVVFTHSVTCLDLLFKVRLQVLNAWTVAHSIKRRWCQTWALANHRQVWSCIFGNLKYCAVLFVTVFAKVLQALLAMLQCF